LLDLYAADISQPLALPIRQQVIPEYVLVAVLRRELECWQNQCLPLRLGKRAEEHGGLGLARSLIDRSKLFFQSDLGVSFRR
jgi:hypothetical protein